MFCAAYAAHIRLNCHVKLRTNTTFYFGRLRPYHQHGATYGEEFLELMRLQRILVLAVLALSLRLNLGYLPATPKDILKSFH